MCTIGGWYAWGKARPDPSTLQGILMCGSRRGGKNNEGSNDATGIAYLKDDAVLILKDGDPAKKFIEEVTAAQWEEIADSPRGLLHNRAITKGSKMSASNHPVVLGEWVAVHNGTIVNDDDVFEHFAVKRPADVDSIAIPLVLGAGKDFYDSLSQLSVLDGGVTTAVWKTTEPDKIALARWGNNPLNLWLEQTPKGDIVYWSGSLAVAGYMPSVKLGALSFTQEIPVTEGRVIVFTPEKVRTFTLERNPFRLPAHPKSWMGATTSSSAQKETASAGPSQTAAGSAGLTSAKTTTVGSTRSAEKWVTQGQCVGYMPDRSWVFPARPIWECTFKWELVDQSIFKPGPVFDRIEPRWMDQREIHNELVTIAGVEGKASRSYSTAYGFWHYHCYATDLGPLKIDRYFAPAKRMKEFFHTTFGKNTLLPIVRKGYEHEFDSKLPLERFTIMEKATDGTKRSMNSFGWMCPVCGAVEHSNVWGMQGYMCAFCCIRSFIPTERR